MGPTGCKTKVQRNVSQRTFSGMQKTQIWRKVSRRVFCGICTGASRARKIMRRCFAHRTHRKALRDPLIPTDAKKSLA
jgi:hypothetical protein